MRSVITVISRSSVAADFFCEPIQAPVTSTARPGKNPWVEFHLAGILVTSRPDCQFEFREGFQRGRVLLVSSSTYSLAVPEGPIRWRVKFRPFVSKNQTEHNCMKLKVARSPARSAVRAAGFHSRPTDRGGPLSRRRGRHQGRLPAASGSLFPRLQHVLSARRFRGWSSGVRHFRLHQRPASDLDDRFQGPRCGLRHGCDHSLRLHGLGGRRPGAPPSDSYFGIGDIQLEPLLLSWHLPQFDIAAGYAVWAPTGDFSPERPDMLAKGFWSHMLTLGRHLAYRCWRKPGRSRC